MDDAQFWTIIKRAKSDADGDPEAIAEGVHAQLSALTGQEIESFNSMLWTKLAAAYNWKLWGAAYLINGGCSDDGFVYFRGWLITQGEKVYEAALADPDTLAKVIDPENDHYECEDILGVAMRAYEEVTGNSLSPPTGAVQPATPAGENWDFNDAEETAKRLPRLARKYNV
jgi:hypothetical protein